MKLRFMQRASRNKKRRSAGRGKNASRRSYTTRRVALWLALCFPAGLFFMWSDRCEWNRALKTGVSMFIAAALTVILLPQTKPPERFTGGVEIVTEADEMIGPMPTAGFERIDLYSYNIVTDSVLAEPEPTPEPIYVYCNDMGKYYHSQECVYVKNTSVRVTHLRALDAGYSQCPDCSAPPAY